MKHRLRHELLNALLISKRSHVLKLGDIILIFNVALFLVVISVLGVESALYSILTYIAAARTLDFVIYGLEEFTAITIGSAQSAAIRGLAALAARPEGRALRTAKGSRLPHAYPVVSARHHM